MPPDERRDAATLERISWELVRLRTEADAIGQPLLGFMLDQASVLAGDELARLRLSGEGPSPLDAPPKKAGRLYQPRRIGRCMIHSGVAASGGEDGEAARIV